MIVLTCRCIPQPGQEDEARAAARELNERSQDHDGLRGYFWNVDPTSHDLRLVEVHADAASVLNHIALTDFTRLGSISTVTDITLYGDPPTPELRAALGHFGAYRIFPAL
jgi:quinol monooxygenase YgiN